MTWEGAGRARKAVWGRERDGVDDRRESEVRLRSESESRKVEKSVRTHHCTAVISTDTVKHFDSSRGKRRQYSSLFTLQVLKVNSDFLAVITLMCLLTI